MDKGDQNIRAALEVIKETKTTVVRDGQRSGIKPVTNGNNFQVTAENWKPQYNRILILAMRGRSIKDISKEIGYSANTVSRVLNSSYFQGKLQERRDKVETKTMETYVDKATISKAKEVFLRAVPFAAKKIVKLAREGDTASRLQFDACKDILDRVGYQPPQVTETTERVVTSTEIQSSLATLQELENTLTRIEDRGSRFILKRPSPQEEVADSADSSTDTPDASSPGPETVPEKPILPM
jgi:hypothetical protein